MTGNIGKYGMGLVIVLMTLSGLQAQDSTRTQEPEQAKIVLPAKIDTLSLLTPRRAVASHLMYLQDDNYHPELSVQTLTAPDLSPEEKVRIARKLKQIYDGENFFVVIEEIPDDPAYVDSVSGKPQYAVFPKYPDIYLEAKGGLWRYSRRTVNRIPEIHQEIFPFGADLLVNLFPRIGQRKVLGMRLWQLLGLLALALLSLVLYKLLDWLAGVLIRRILPRIFTRQIIDIGKIPPLAHPLSLLAVTLIVSQLERMLLLGEYALGREIDSGLGVFHPAFFFLCL